MPNTRMRTDGLKTDTSKAVKRGILIRMKTALNNPSLKTGNGQRHHISGAHQELDELEILTSGFEVEVRYQKWTHRL